MGKELLFSVRRKEFDVQTFRSGGKGGQHQNTTNSGCRIIHRASGARGEARDTRHYIKNRRMALRRLAATKTFQLWLKIQTAEHTGQMRDIERRAAIWAEEQMDPKYLKIEYDSENIKNTVGEH